MWCSFRWWRMWSVCGDTFDGCSAPAVAAWCEQAVPHVPRFPGCRRGLETRTCNAHVYGPGRLPGLDCGLGWWAGTVEMANLVLAAVGTGPGLVVIIISTF